MTSKNSLRNNTYKRHLWVMISYAVILFFGYPGAILMDTNIFSGIKGMTRAIRYFYYNPMLVIFVLLAGMVSAFDAFGWVYNRAKTDFAASQPIKASDRCILLYKTGLRNFVIPFTGALILGQLALVLRGGGFIWLPALAAWTWIHAIISYLAVFSLTVIAIVLTGNMATGVLATGVFFGYEILLKMAVMACRQEFLTTYVSRDSEFWVTYFTPLGKMAQMSGAVLIDSTRVTSFLEFWAAYMKPMYPAGFFLIAQAVLFTGIAFMLWKKRPMEAAGESVAFKFVQAPVKIAMMGLCSLLFGLIFYYIFNYEKAYTIIGALVGGLACQIIMQMIFERDFRGLFKQPVSMVVGLVLGIALMVTFENDLLGYDSWVPAAEEVKNVAVFPYLENYYRFEYVDEQGNVTWSRDAMLDRMNLGNDADALALVSYLAQHNGKSSGDGATELEGPSFYDVVVKYELKNGKTAYRSYSVAYGDALEYWDKLYANPKFKEGLAPILQNNVAEAVKKGNLTWAGTKELETGKKQDLEIDTEAFWDAYTEDYKEASATELDKAIPVGVVGIDFPVISDGRSEYYNLQYPVFSCFKRSYEMLREAGMDVSEGVNMTAEKVEVTYWYYNYDAATEEEFRAMKFNTTAEEATYDGYNITLTYTDPQKIKEILNACVSDDLCGWAFSANGYYGNIYAEPVTEDTEYFAGTYKLASSLTPNYVLNDIKAIMEQVPVE